MMIGAISNSYMNYNLYGAGSIPSIVASSSDERIDPAAKNPETSSDASNAIGDEKKKPGRASSPEECQTCKNRKYQDGSNEMNVSFKNAAHISPEAAASAVRSHEGQHVKNAYAKAEQANGKVVSATVSIHTAVCPECGRTYVSGGTTNTVIKYPNESNPYQQSRKSQDSLSLLGANLDYAV